MASHHGGSYLSHKESKWGLCVDTYVLSLQPLPPSSFKQKASFEVHKFCWPSGKEDICCPIPSNIDCDLESSTVILTVPFVKQLFCPSSPCKQQATTGKLLHDDLPRSCQGQGSDSHILGQHLATALTYSCRNTEHKL